LISENEGLLAYCVEVLKHWLVRMKGWEVLKHWLVRMKCEARLEHRWFLHESASAHAAINVRTFLSKNGVTVHSHPLPFSLVPPILFLFSQLKCCQLYMIFDIKNYVMAALNIVAANKFPGVSRM
jgi:hypothetical protein